MTNSTITTVSVPRGFRAASVRTEGIADDNTIDVVWTTGADVLRCDPWDGDYIERLATDPDNVRLDRLNAGAAFLDTHNSYELGAVIGSVVPGSARMEGGQGLCKVRLSQSARAADTVRDIRDGVIRNVSVGYNVYAFSRTEASDESPAVMIATDWEPVEVSACPVGADAGAQIKSAVRSASGLELNKCTITRTNISLISKEATLADEKLPVDGEDKNKRAAEDKADDTMKVDDKKADADKEDKTAEEVLAETSRSADVSSDHLKRMVEAAAAEAFERGSANERVRQSDIMTFVRRYGLEDLGIEHCRLGTKLQAVKDIVLDKLAETSARNAPNLNAVRDTSLEQKEDFAFARQFYGKKK